MQIGGVGGGSKKEKKILRERAKIIIRATCLNWTCGGNPIIPKKKKKLMV